MSKKPWHTLTGQPGTSLDGAYLQDYTKQWYPISYRGAIETSPNEPPLLIQWSEEQKGLEIKHELHIQATSGTPDPINFAQRLICYYLLSKLPDHGVPEICGNIIDAYEFYTYVPKEYPSLPVIKSVQAGEGIKYQRPDFEISDD